ncbi:NUDIX hydrolase [Aquamicrobium sp. LC103]|uniref:NUDIX hydrolase n=1 Tax=Aquamicrobium sp. LC103 TaxID=1120658 RepID=UPI00063EB9FB|nr:NUDIX hydrolase [Aquamicrobium sp. LC103]TKT76825.1 NUDIX domain-containing protein [Aquamicrobium sp. LC103]
MEGMTRAEIDQAESKDFAIGSGPKRPRDAATLILLDRAGGRFKVLMGRRHMRHAFMPGKFVFPGGRTDPADSRIQVVSGLHPEEERKLAGTGSRASTTRARAIALSAVRETYEEAGLLIGRKGEFQTTKADWQGFSDHGVQPSLEALRFVARAITPPGRVRRFDTRFLAAWREDVAVALAEGGPTNELEELVWLPIDEAKLADIPSITRTVLGDIEARLKDDPSLRPGGPVPFYRLRHNRFRRDIL